MLKPLWTNQHECALNDAVLYICTNGTIGMKCGHERTQTDATANHARIAFISSISPASHPLAMLTEIYIETLLVDEELADQVRTLWYSGEIEDAVALLA